MVIGEDSEVISAFVGEFGKLWPKKYFVVVGTL